MRISLPPGLARYVVEKGSDRGRRRQPDRLGLSASGDRAAWFEVSLIPETLERTTLGRKQPGEPVNLEVDMIAKYVETAARPGARDDSVDHAGDGADDQQPRS